MPNSIEYARIADIYDTFVTTDLDVPFFITEAQKVQGDVLELMSGTGRVSIPLIEAGTRLTCVDNSPEMLNVLRDKLEKQNLSASMHEMDVRNLQLKKKFELIILPFHSFSELVSESDQRRALSAIYDHLSENGHFICTLHNPSVRLKSVDSHLHLMGKYDVEEGKLLFWMSETHHPDSGLVEGVEIFEEYGAKGFLRSKRMMEIRFRLLSTAEFEKMSRAANFKTTALYGDYAYSEFREKTSPFMVWILEK